MIFMAKYIFKIYIYISQFCKYKLYIYSQNSVSHIMSFAHNIGFKCTAQIKYDYKNIF